MFQLVFLTWFINRSDSPYFPASRKEKFSKGNLENHRYHMGSNVFIFSVTWIFVYQLMMHLYLENNLAKTWVQRTSCQVGKKIDGGELASKCVRGCLDRRVYSRSSIFTQEKCVMIKFETTVSLVTKESTNCTEISLLIFFINVW